MAPSYPQGPALIGRRLGRLTLLTGGLVGMTRRLTGRRLIVVACLLTFVAAGCTPSGATTPPPPPPSTATPTETAQEREERLAYEAAEKSYREFRAEFNRVLIAGGAKKATSIMTATASGSYLKDNLEVAEAYHGLGYRQQGSEKIVFIRRNGYSSASVLLLTCEDSTGTETIGKGGKQIGRGDRRRLDLEVHNTGGRWMVWSGTGQQVKSCDN